MTPTLFCIGCGAGFSGDRLDAAEPVVDTLIARGLPAALMFETLAERTLALAQLERQRNPDAGYEPMLEALLEPILAKCARHAIPIIGNFGAAHPRAAARTIAALGRRLGLNRLRIAVVEGDDIRGRISLDQLTVVDGDASLAATSAAELLAANVYLGAAEIAQALAAGVEVVVTGRVADPALALGPLIHHFGWRMDDWDHLAAGTLAGHLLECGAQVSGGYFADPGHKDVPDLAEVGFPIAEVGAEGDLVITKADHTGGLVDTRTVKEQLLYEIHDPGAYLTPDVTLDISGVRVAQLGANRVQVSGARGKPRPATLKATASFAGDWLGEGEISYAGANAAARARLAAAVLRKRLAKLQLAARARIDLIGLISVFDGDAGTLAATQTDAAPDDVRLRLAVSAADRTSATRAAREVLALYCTGPAGGGGVRWQVTPRIKTLSYLVPREQVEARWSFYEE